MIGTRIVLKRGRQDDAEKPFWISYADLMTALMVLFLVTMAVSLLSVTRKIDESERRKQEYKREIQQLMDDVEAVAKKDFPTVKVDKENRRINFGKQAQFALNSAVVPADAARTLRAFVPKILGIARSPLGRQWLNQIVLEGFASPEGGYFLNLKLSMERSRAVLCSLFAKPGADEVAITDDELKQIQDLFLIGGYSFNAVKPTPEESRRVEIRLDFLGLDEQRPAPIVRDRNSSLDKCAG